MYEQALNVLLIEDNAGDAELVREMLADTAPKDIKLDWVEALLAALDRLANGGIDLVLLDLSLPDSQGLSALTAIRLHAPDLPVVILTGYDNEALAVEAVQCGVQDYLAKSRLNGEALVRSIRYALARQQPQSGRPSVGAPNLAKIVGFLGAKGGVGTTTICCHMATEMRRRVDRVLISDLDTAGDAISFLLKAESPHTLLDATNNILRLDVAFWDKIVGKSSAGLDVLRSLGPLYMAEEPRAERIRYVFRYIRPQYDWIFVDLGRIRPSITSLIGEFAKLFIVSTTDVLSLYAAKQIGQKLADLRVPTEEIGLVLNRVPRHYFMSAEDLYRFVGIPACARLPEEGTAVSDAYEAGKLLGREKAFCREIGRMGTMLSGVEEEEPAKGFSLFAHKLQQQLHL